MSDDYVEICRLPYEVVRLGTLVRLGTSLGWSLDGLAVGRALGGYTVLLRRKGVTVNRPPVTVLVSSPRVIELAAEDPEAGEHIDVREADPPSDPDPELTTDAPPVEATNGHAPIDSLNERTCHKCGKVFATRNGRLIHNGRQHGDDPNYVATAAELERQRTQPEASSTTSLRLQCEEPACHFTCEYAVDMNSHTRQAHGRPPSRQERIPVAG